MSTTIQSQIEHLQSKYTGTGHADTTQRDWAIQQKRDAYASFMGHPGMMDYFSVAYNEPKERVRCKFLSNMEQPCGPDPSNNDDAVDED